MSDMAMSDKWKKNFLSSGLPLEYEAAKILAAHGFFVRSNYSYRREAETGVQKDFSVDLHAYGHMPFVGDEPDLDCTLGLLIECKQNVRNTKWLFLPEINKYHNIRGEIARIANNFADTTIYYVDRGITNDPSNKIPVCFKGTQILPTGEVFDKEIVSGIEQLRYALPMMFVNEIRLNIEYAIVRGKPSLICPILLTTASLYVMNQDTTIQDVENSDSIEQLATKVPYLVNHSSVSPDFVNYWTRVFSSTIDLLNLPETKELDELRANSHRYLNVNSTPTRLIKWLMSANEQELDERCSLFLICSLDAFPALLNELKHYANKFYNSGRNLHELEPHEKKQKPVMPVDEDDDEIPF